MAAAMELKLRCHDDDRGDGAWIEDEPLDLLCRLKEEIEELLEALKDLDEDWEIPDVMLECADVANFSMFIFDALRYSADSIELPGSAILEELDSHAIDKQSFRAGWLAGWRRCVVQFTRMLTWASVNPIKHTAGMEMDLRAHIAAGEAVDPTDATQLTIADGEGETD